MISLLIQNLRHIVRTRLLVVLLCFSFLIQFVGLRALHFVTFRFQGITTLVEGANAVFPALIFQLFAGAFIAAAYGIWMVPYAHQGARTPLTFTLPISKWMFPLAYGVTMLALLLAQHGVLLMSYGMNFGFESFHSPDFPWAGLKMALVLETLAFEVLMFAFALCSMVAGQVPTFFLGALSVFLLQIAGVVLRAREDIMKLAPESGDKFDLVRAAYNALPPVGELVFDLRKTFLKPGWDKANFQLWLAWLAILIVLFRVRLAFPGQARAGES